MEDEKKEITEEEKAEEEKEEVTEEQPAEEEAAEENVEEEQATEETEESAGTEATEAGKDKFGRTLYKVTCSECGKETEVPFKPSGDRPVYCRECFQKKRPRRY